MTNIAFQVLKSFACVMVGVFFGIIGAGFVASANWLVAGILLFFASCAGIAAVLLVPSSSDNKSRSEP